MIQSLEDVVLSLDFGRVDGKQDFDSYFLFCFAIFALEHMGIPPSTNLVRDCILFQFTE